MTLIAIAAGSAALLSLAGPAFVRWCARAGDLPPRHLLALWTVALLAWAVSWATLVFTVVAEVMGPGLKGFVTACITLFQAVSSSGAGTVVAVLAPVAALAAGRLCWVLARRYAGSVRWRREHHRELTAGARQRCLDGHDVWLLQARRPHAYCVPGRRSGVVLTQGALDVLSPKELRAVLAHEDAHLRGHHHVLVAASRLLDTAFPGVPLLRAAVTEVPVLVEWAADDHAARTVGHAPLLHAIGVMVAPPEPDPSGRSLAASGACPVERARRLLPGQSAGNGRSTRAVTALSAAILLAVPPAAVLGAAVLTVAGSPPCVCTI
ncbi:M56 family metallopeptidase [Nocardiopsis sp. HNM0947]|uniref:M56 family metallopeptidase n=1 Tax=Nocardiopsis coralli TaxID=2772213 RepID=A0ABR9P2L8_9ACTN|nr:M56 family metallopeptidase [Nocardiopsis coralli]MBE2998047.1 M56 family metallopeptidase [Nocardiopsis coralli]